ncbi:MAG: helix-turn-helix domain-containing protein [Myxococcales bacterium]|nr:helix-turn-helix domain-containing protein [Myxococcales bacterium]
MPTPLPDLLHVRELDQARVLLHPVRVAVLQRMREPTTVAELATALDMTPQRMNHHVKALLEAGLIEAVREERVRNFVRTSYRAKGKVVWLSPELARDPQAEAARERDALSLSALLTMAEEVQHDVGALLSRSHAEEVPSLGLRLEVHLADEEARRAFAQDVLDALAPVVERYQGPADAQGPFTLNVLCYPKEAPDGDS